MTNYTKQDYERDLQIVVEAQGVAEAMFDYLPWPSLDVAITFRNSEGWIVIDNYTDFRYEVTSND